MFFLKSFRYIDWLLFGAVVCLSLIGAMTVYSASYQLSAATGILFLQRQVLWLLIGLALFLVISIADYRKVLSLAYIICFLTTAMLVVIVVLGESRFGARRWIQLGGFTIQPSEFAKLALILVLARYLSDKFTRRSRWIYILVPCCLSAAPAFLILKQPDLGTAVIFLLVTLGMIFIAGGRLKYILIIVLILALISPAFWFVLKEYQKNRLMVFINPDLDPLGSGYTVIQSKIAIGAGGIWGKGWLAGTQNMLSFLPERQTDYVFSVVAEEWGFAGCLVVLGLYSLILYRLFMIARAAREVAGKLLVVGGMLVLASHVGINIGMAVGLLPATGLPLPLISYGGSVTITMLAIVGLCESVYSHRYWY